MEDDCVTDTNTLYVQCDALDEKSVTAYLKTLISQTIKAIKTLPAYSGIRLKETFLVNVPRNGKTFCYVWIDSCEVVNVILGLNPNGTKRETVKTEVADEVDDSSDDWFAEPVVTKTVTVLPPLICIPPLRTAGVDNEINFGRYYCKYPSEDYQHSSLIATKVPTGITNDMLIKKFERFGMHGKPRVVRKGTTAFVNFEGTSNDAIFAKEMCMFSRFQLGTGSHTLMFVHPRK